MSVRRVVFFGLLISLSSSLCAWTLVKEDAHHNLRIYTQSVDHSAMKAYRGTMRLRSSLAAPIALLQDNTVAEQWMHNVAILEVIEEVSDSERLMYMISKAPWPVKDRDSVVHTQVTQDTTSYTVRVDVIARDDVFPANDDFVRVNRMQGYWQFTPLENGYIDIVYEAHADPSGAIPAWLANTVVVDVPFYTLLGMQRMLKKQNYQQQTVEYLQLPAKRQ